MDTGSCNALYNSHVVLINHCATFPRVEPEGSVPEVPEKIEFRHHVEDQGLAYVCGIRQQCVQLQNFIDRAPDLHGLLVGQEDVAAIVGQDALQPHLSL